MLLKNENKALPILPPAKGKPKTKVAVIGPNAKARSISGGGSANLKPSYVVKPFDGIMEHVTGPGRGAFEVEYHVGCYCAFTNSKNLNLFFSSLTSVFSPLHTRV